MPSITLATRIKTGLQPIMVAQQLNPTIKTAEPDRFIPSTPQPAIIDKKLYQNANSFIQSLPLNALQHPIQLIELGSRMIRVLVIPGKQGQVKAPYFMNYPSPLGESLGQHNGLITPEAQQKLIDTFKQLKWDLPDGVNMEDFNCITTSGLRDASNQTMVIKSLKAQTGLKHIEILTPEREASYSYVGTLRNLKSAQLRKNMVLDIGSGSIQIALGNGNAALEKGMSFALPVGSNRIRLDDPFDPMSVKLSTLYVSEMINPLLKPDLINKTQGINTYLNESRIFKVLAQIHQQQSGQPLLNQDKQLTKGMVKYYLTAQGLGELQKVYEKNRSFHDDLILTIPKKLIVLSVLMDKLGLDHVQFGQGSCLRAGYCVEAAEEQLKKTLTPVANTLSATYKKALPGIAQDFKSIFPNFDEYFIFRAKSPISILDKLVKIGLDPKNTIDVHNLKEAQEAVQDGIGIRTKQLPYTKQAFTQSLKRLVTEKNYVTRRYTNYESMDGLNYLDPKTLDTHFPPVANPDNKTNRIREVIRRPNNYMTTQLYFQPAGVKDYFVELQIRGPEVNQVGDAEHMYYDLRRRKNLTRGIPALQAIVEPVDIAVNTLNKDQTRRYEAYLAECYKTARLREKEQEAYYPPLPDDINNLLEVNHLRMVKERLAAYDKKTRPLPLKS